MEVAEKHYNAGDSIVTHDEETVEKAAEIYAKANKRVEGVSIRETIKLEF